MAHRNLTLPALLVAVGLAGCAAVSTPPGSCPPCPGTETPRPTVVPPRAAHWNDLPGWADEDHPAMLELFRAQCRYLTQRPLWRSACAAAAELGAGGTAPADARGWFETHFRPWQLLNPDGEDSGLITGYYEPVVRGSRVPTPPYLTPVFGPPDDLVTVDLAGLYPELKNLRLRGRLEGKRLVPYYSRAEWAGEAERRTDQAMLWVDDPVDFFFLQIQGSGQVTLQDGSRVRIGYADQNGHPYRSIGRWLIEQGELTSRQATMQGIKTWAAAHPQRLTTLLDANPSLVFFRELKAEGSGPPGALGIPLTPERSLAVDTRYTPLGTPVWLATTHPESQQPLRRLMLAQDTGGAIRGPVRADYYWGSGNDAGTQAGQMKQNGRLWLLLPHEYRP